MFFGVIVNLFKGHYGVTIEKFLKPFKMRDNIAQTYLIDMKP